MSHNPLTALVEENKRYFTFFNVSIALILITGAEIAIIEMPTGGVQSTYRLFVKFICVIAWFAPTLGQSTVLNPVCYGFGIAVYLQL